MTDGYSVPFSSSPPSTPPGSRPGRHGANNGFFMNSYSNLPTASAHLQSSSAASFTPAGPPPSTIFGSSPTSGQPLFAQSRNAGARHSQSAESHTFTSPDTKRRSPKKSPKRSPKKDLNPFSALPKDGTQFTGLQSSPTKSFGQVSEGDDYDEEEDGDYVPESSDEDSDEDYEDDEDASVEEEMQQDVEMAEPNPDIHPNYINFDSYESQQALASSFTQSEKAYNQDMSNFTSRRGVKRSRQGAPLSHNALYNSRTGVSKRRQSIMTAISKDISKQLGPAKLTEPDDLIIDTEINVTKVYPDENSSQDTERTIESALLKVPDTLCKVWRACFNANRPEQTIEQEYIAGIGPSDSEPTYHKAAYVADLLFKIYHPPGTSDMQSVGLSRFSHLAIASRTTDPDKSEVFPKVLLEWLNANHDPFRNAIAGLRSYQPNPTAHENFWDIIFSAALRGKLAEIIYILRNSDFTFARTAKDDGHARNVYDKLQLGIIQKVVRSVIEVLESSPIYRDENWVVSGNQWVLFRRKVEKTLDELSVLAEGRTQVYDPILKSLEATNFGLTTTSAELTTSTRRAESKVPWTIYQHVRALYGLLLGRTAELMSSAQDWLEATIALTVWWDGSDDDDDDFSVIDVPVLQRNKKPGPQLSRLVDTQPGVAYRKRLSAAFERVTNESIDDALQIDPSNPVEVAIASMFEGDIENVLALLQSWSLPIASSVVEIATQGGWYESPPGTLATKKLFDESDLLVLSYGQVKQTLSKDGIICRYAEALLTRSKLEHSQSEEAKEGWEVSIELLSRLDNRSLANQRISDILSQLSVKSDERADKIIDLCRSFDLNDDACRIAEKYANYIAENTDQYGTALIYYARAHNSKKVKDVLDLLISYCLVYSSPYPPVGSLDPHLSNLLCRPRDSLLWLAELDPVASEILSIQMSGYATLRKFYDLRDEQPYNGRKLRLTPRLKAAASSLLAVIASSADNIQGGLFDKSNTAVVSVDGLLVLLGEATAFVDQPVRLLSLHQILVLLRAIEDLQTVHPHIRSQCGEFLSSTLASASGSAIPANPRALMKTSVSELTASSGFSLVGSSMLSNGKGKNKDTRRRGCDWRNGLPPGTNGDRIISILRIGIARDVSRAWLDGEEI